ncbi:MAG: hypothetical protein AB7E48_00490 [Deferribacterales bacterium]
MAWDKIARTGSFTDMNGNTYTFTDDILKRLVRSFKTGSEKVPLVLGHPETDYPAHGWIKDLRVNNGFLEAQYENLSEELKRLVQEGRFKYKSISVNGGLTKLKHLGILGAVAPAMSGLGSIQFNKYDNGIVMYFAEKVMEGNMTLEELGKMVEQQQDEIEKCRRDIDALMKAIAAGGTSSSSFASSSHYGVSGQKMASKL